MTNKKVKAYIGLGSNLGDRCRNINRGLTLLGGCPSVKITKVSSLIETAPVGGPPQGKYLNGAVEIETELEATLLLEYLQQIEKLLGRTREVRWGPRTVDLDILLYGDEIIKEEDLTVPHPRMHQRRFVLEPMCEIAPALKHPKSGKTINQLLQELPAPE